MNRQESIRAIVSFRRDNEVLSSFVSKEEVFVYKSPASMLIDCSNINASIQARFLAR